MAGTSGNFGIGLTSHYDITGHLYSIQSTYADSTHPSFLFSADPQAVGSPTYGAFGFTGAAMGLSSPSQPGLLSRIRSYDSMGRVSLDVVQAQNVTGSGGGTPTPPASDTTVVLHPNPVAAGVTAVAQCDNAPAVRPETVSFYIDGNPSGGFSYTPGGAMGALVGPFARPWNSYVSGHLG